MEPYTITPGDKLEWWLNSGLLRAPGGSEVGCSFSTPSDEGAPYTVRCNAPITEKKPLEASKQWLRAQQAEIHFWETFRQSALYAQVDMIEHWRGVLDRTGGDIPAGIVLDVGCGPCGVLNYFRSEATSPLGVDPLAEAYYRHGITESRPGFKPIAMAAVPAEKLPLASQSVDHAICYNVLDHVQDATAVLREIHRVLKPGGTLRTYIHSFVSWAKPLLSWDKPHTYHWTHEEFLALMLGAGFLVERTGKEPKDFHEPKGFMGKLKFLPYRVAPYVMSTTYAVHVKR